jgi:hypothetical protein
LITYADDGGAVVKGSSREMGAYKANKIIDAELKWAEKNGLTLKVTSMHLISGLAVKNWSTNISFQLLGVKRAKF